MLVDDVVVGPHDAAGVERVVEERVVLLARHAVVEQVLVHRRGHRVPVREVERQEASQVEHARELEARRIGGVEVLGRLVLDEEWSIRAGEDRPHREHVRLRQMLDGRDERAVAGEPLVPPAVAGGEEGGDEDLVDRRVEPERGIAAGERAGVLRERTRQLRVLEALEPVGDAEVQQVDDGLDPQSRELGEGLVGERPVVPSGTEMHAVVRRAVAEEAAADLLHEREILAPPIVVAGPFHLVDAAGRSVLGADGRVAPLDAGREEEGPHVGWSLPFRRE